MNLDELRSKVTALNDERKKIVQAEGQKAIAGAFADLFDKHPKLESVTWAQYTPFFNDGEACEFSYHGMREATYDGSEIEDPEYADVEELPADVRKSVKALGNSLEKLGECLEIIFGDHVKVTATRNGFNIDECEHD